jgi:UDP-N-acetylmuramate dehydrogenase
MRDVPLAAHTSYQIGGNADYFAMPETVEQLQALIQGCSRIGMPYYIFGYGSNILFPDKPKQGKLFISFKKLIDTNIVVSNGEMKIFLAAGIPLAYLALVGISCNYDKLLFTHLLPGSIGAGIYINAKCYEDQMSGIIDTVYYIDTANGDSQIQSISVNDCQFAYKRSIFQGKPWIIVGADFKILMPNELDEDLLLKMKKDLVIDSELAAKTDITKLDGFYQYFKNSAANLCNQIGRKLPEQLIGIDTDRNNKYHFSYPSCGSVFKNNYDYGTPMGVIIDQLQLKGKEHGGAMISPYHGNFIINCNHAKASDVQYLIQLVQEAVNNKLGFVPEPEVVIISE